MKPLALYDADCGFCTRWIGVVQRRVPGVAVASLNHVDLAALGVLLGVAGVTVLRYKLQTSVGSSRIQLANTLAPIDFSHPDALILSERLSALPRDLLKVPLLKAKIGRAHV